jgi:hypothetical protein
VVRALKPTKKVARLSEDVGTVRHVDGQERRKRGHRRHLVGANEGIDEDIPLDSRHQLLLFILAAKHKGLAVLFELIDRSISLQQQEGVLPI